MKCPILVIGVLLGVSTTASAQQPCTTDARHVVDEIYRHVLERAADPASAGWVDGLAKGSTNVREVVRDIAKSPEHLQRFGSDARAVDTLYRHILGRQPDAAGQRTYAGILASRGLAAVVDQIVSSPEYQQSFGDWGVPGSGGVSYCAKGAGSTQTRTQADRSQTDRGQVDQNQANRNPTDRNQADRNQPDRNPDYRNPADQGQPDRYPNDRNQADRYQPARDRSVSSIRFRVMDANNDGVISRREWTGDPNSFRLYDWNGDGVLSGDELDPYSTPPVDNRGTRNHNTWNADRFEYLDLNGDRFVERNEWDGGRDAFDRLDRTRDGRLTRNELNAGYTSRASNFNSLDANRDRRITLNEWPWSHRSFDEEDLNNDGVIAREEFRGDPVVTTGRGF